MESQCDYSMYFPAVPFPPREFLAGESSGYRALPRRNHLYLGETVRFLLVLHAPSAANFPGKTPWAQLAASLSALATVTSGDSRARHEEEPDPARDPGDFANNPGHFGDAEDSRQPPPLFRECRALLTHSRAEHSGIPGSLGIFLLFPIIS
uniref:TRAPP14 N-terminal domain-containing protein n=1 Tax=Serinus canaria TaxID=9135 RepID=A0A8C9KX18_SERCA